MAPHDRGREATSRGGRLDRVLLDLIAVRDRIVILGALLVGFALLPWLTPGAAEAAVAVAIGIVVVVPLGYLALRSGGG